MLHSLAAGTIILLAAASTPFGVAAATIYGRSAAVGLGHSSVYRGGQLARPGSAGRFGSGIGSASAGSRYGHFNQQGSGWSRGGFGGTLNPGWGYQSGPGLGGIGR
jgi:hypothetical protein